MLNRFFPRPERRKGPNPRGNSGLGGSADSFPRDRESTDSFPRDRESANSFPRDRESANSFPCSKEAGFTLTELLVVVALIGLIGAVAMPTIGSIFKISLNSATRNLASAIKETYNSTVITGRVHRIVWDLKENEYWVETSTGTEGVLLDTPESREREEHRKRFATPTDEPPPSPFVMDKTITRKKQPLPRGVRFEDVMTEQGTEPITEGQAFTHFFPHGVTEKSVVHLKDDSDRQISLVISSIIGTTNVVNHYVTAEEADEY